MHCRPAVLGVALAALSILTLSASPTRMPVDEIRPGMIGVGRTVFEGDRIEEFKVQFIGVLRNVMGPSRNLILARLDGGPLASTGVIAGMSGSPGLCDGRIVGAVSYSLGAFSKEPIAGITPIDEMIEAAGRTERRAVPLRAELDLPVTQASLAATLRRSFAVDRPFADSPADVQVLASGSSAVAAQIGPDAPADLHASGHRRLRRRGGRPARRRLPRRRVHADERHRRHRGDSRVHASARAGRCGRRQPDRRRPVARRHRHGHPRRGWARLRVRASLLQPGADRVPDDARVRARAASEPDVVDEALDHGRDHRHVPAGSRGDDCGRARRRTVAHPDHGRARNDARPEAHVQVPGRARPAVHAGPRLRLGAEYAQVVRARVRRRDVYGEGPRGHPRARRGRSRRPLHR